MRIRRMFPDEEGRDVSIGEVWVEDSQTWRIEVRLGRSFTDIETSAFCPDSIFRSAIQNGATPEQALDALEQETKKYIEVNKVGFSLIR